MTYNLRFDKLKKQKSDTDIEGFVLVTFSQNSITKVVSTKRIITRVQYDKYFNKDFKRFTPTKVIDSKAINQTIEEILKYQNPFKKVTVIGFVAYFQKQLKYVTNPNTNTSYQYVIDSFKAFLGTKNKEDISFSEMNIELFREYKFYLDTDPKISFGTIKYYFIVLKSFINKANDDELCNINLPLKKFNLTSNPKRPIVLNDNDIDLLMSFDVTNPLYKYVQFSLLQLFGNGLRFSDCLLIKLSDFKANYLEVKTMKVKIILQIPYTPTFIDAICRILNKDYVPVLTYNRAVNNSIKDYNHQFINDAKRVFILDYIDRQTDRFLFDFLDPVLMDIDKTRAMTPAQHHNFLKTRMFVNCQLNKVRRLLKLSVSTYTTHSMRYAYTRISLQNNIPIHLLSKSLGHSTIGITERYIRETFNVDDYSVIGNMMANKFKQTFDDQK